jgi:uncharacterized membrane protein YhaH (DUF805 family)
MGTLANIFSREQVGLDRGQGLVFALAFVATGLGAIPAIDYSPIGKLGIFLYLFGLFLFILAFCYAALSIVFTRGHWRQYCTYLILCLVIPVCVTLFFMLPNLARAKE